ncbi:BRCA1-associated protein [Frankliniella occidentalis]|uniref:BRCA1-associated protein n=1 Tax=Frankliniella occidentalis TaxID=133901 RepID=A0A6J1T2U0_FRAOC|nr:BRCA1-associated protein [Frankliniella occidentalis]
MSIAVSLCVIHIELGDETNLSTKGALGAMAAKNIELNARRGRREMRDITVETYSRTGVKPTPVLPKSSAWETGQTAITLFPSAPANDDTPSFPLAKPNDSIGKQSLASQSSVSEDDIPPSRRSVDLDEADPMLRGERDRERDPSLINFVSGNPFVEVTKGILHLYKEDSLTDMESASQLSQTVCLLAVPATMTCHDLLTFTAACHAGIQHVRVLRDGTPNQYMVLITFRTQQAAAEFYKSYNGVPYNTLEPDVCCHLVFVSKVELVREDVPPPHHTELPTCPVCLERMDESVDGILTILCNHAFHTSCLAKWGDTSCPVCRYVQTPELVADNRCLECHSAEQLWICLICGHVGCGRYVKGHAYDHYDETKHCYSMQLGSNRVWDYVGDNFVHRLLQNKGDGKLVEGSAPGKQDVSDEKLDSVQLEFTYMLTSQLDSQRMYFEEQLVRLDQQTSAERTELKEEVQQLREENKVLQSKVSSLTKEKQMVEKKLQQFSERLGSTQKELQEEKQLSGALTQNQGGWQKKFTALESQFHQYQTEKDKEISELKEQLRDVMFFLEAQKQISESADRDEIAGGRVTIGEGPQTSTSKSSRRGKKQR